MNLEKPQVNMGTLLKIVFVIDRVTRTGVPLAQLRLAENFKAEGHQVSFIILGSTEGAPKDIVERFGSLIAAELNSRRALGAMVRLCSTISKVRPHVVFASEDHVNVICAIARFVTASRWHLIGSIRLSHSWVSRFHDPRKIIAIKILYRLLKGQFRLVTAVSQDLEMEQRRIHPTLPIKYIPNVISIPVGLSPNVTNCSRREATICYVGSIDSRKGVQDLIVAVSMMRNIQFRVLVVGSGPKLAEYKAMTDQLHLSNRIEFLGEVTNVWTIYSAASLFVLPSYAEGMPNVLIEAIFAGCYFVAYDCPTGPREIADNYPSLGRVVKMGDIPALSSTIMDSLNPPDHVSRADDLHRLMQEFSWRNVRRLYSEAIEC